MKSPILLVFVFGLMAFSPLSAQEIMIHEDLRGDTLVPEFGMNRKHFRHAYVGSQIFLGEAEGPSGEIRTGLSWATEYGMRYKRRFSNVFSGGIEWSIRRLEYIPKNWGMVYMHEWGDLKNERLLLMQTGLGLYQRINFQKRRGDYIGRFLDLGLYGNWNFFSRHIYIFKNTKDERVKVKTTHLSYIEPFDYGVLARLGFGNFVIKGTYRFADHFKESSGLEEFPRFGFGLELGLHPK